MAYPNPPKTWAGLEKLTAALQNAQLRDALLALQDGTWGRDRTWVRKPSTEVVNNSATVQNDDHLLFTAAANAAYRFDAGLLYTVGGSSTTMDFKAGWSLPASATWEGGGRGAEVGLAAGTSIGSGEWVGLTGASAATITFGGNSNGGTLLVWLVGTIVTLGTGGVCNLQWAQASAVAFNLTMLAGSWLEARRVA